MSDDKNGGDFTPKQQRVPRIDTGGDLSWAIPGVRIEQASTKDEEIAAWRMRALAGIEVVEAARRVLLACGGRPLTAASRSPTLIEMRALDDAVSKYDRRR